MNPSEQSVQPGEDARLTCMAWGDPPIALHWSRDTGHALPLTARIRGQGHTLELRGIRRTDAGKYRCTAVNAAGEASAASTLLVGEVGQPRSGRRGEETALVGSTVELRCPSSGSVERHVEWTAARNNGEDNRGFHDSAPLPHNAKVHRGVLRFTNVTLRNAGRYSCTLKVSERFLLFELLLLVKFFHFLLIISPWENRVFKRFMDDSNFLLMKSTLLITNRLIFFPDERRPDFGQGLCHPEYSR